VLEISDWETGTGKDRFQPFRAQVIRVVRGSYDQVAVRITPVFVTSCSQLVERPGATTGFVTGTIVLEADGSINLVPQGGRSPEPVEGIDRIEHYK